MLDFLHNFGLTEKEAFVYELLLKLGETPANRLIKESKLKRATLYKTLYSLEKKGLINQNKEGKILSFRPEPPARLTSLAETQFQSLERAKNSLEAILPQLASSYILSVEKPIVSTFEGVDGLKEIYEDTLREKKPIYALVLPLEVEPKLLSYLRKSYRVRRAKLGIHAYVIASSNKYAKGYKQEDNKYARTTLLVPNDKFPFQHEVNIYGDKLAFINYKKGSRLIGIIIKHPEIAKTAKAWFDLAWEGAEKLYANS